MATAGAVVKVTMVLVVTQVTWHAPVRGRGAAGAQGGVEASELSPALCDSNVLKFKIVEGRIARAALVRLFRLFRARRVNLRVIRLIVV